MIDWTHVEEMRIELGADFDLVVSMFLEEVGEVVARLERSPRPESLPADLHFLKGAALNLGFSDLAQRCSDAELKARAGNPGASYLGSVLSSYGASCAAFRNGPG